nr:hypothetical protein GCM10023233_15760 [Brevibacterium otitidis]
MAHEPTSSVAMTRRERRELENANRTQRSAFRIPGTRRKRSADAGTAFAPAASRTRKVGANAAAFRGSDGSLVRSLKRRRLATVSAMASVSVAGSAVAAMLLIGNTSAPQQVAAGSAVDTFGTSVVGAEAVSTNIESGDSESGAQNYAGGAPSATKDRDAEAASRSVTRTVLPGCSGEAPPGSYSNGQVPDGYLCDVGVGKHKLRADAAVAFAEMNAAFKAETGKDMAITDSYRTLESQVSVAGRKPGLAARPGTSMHGWGVALDFGGGAASASGEQYNWLVKHGAEYGWENPDWAKRSKYEPWHWEYVPARDKIKGQ